MKAFFLLLCVVIARGTPIESVNQINDNMGNFDASIVSNAGSGDINQGDDGNKGYDTYDNEIQRNGSGMLNINAIAGNEDAALVQDSDYNKIDQVGNGNNNMDTVKNQITTNNADSNLTFNVENTDAKTQHAYGNNTVAQEHDNNNASNQYANIQY